MAAPRRFRRPAQAPDRARNAKMTELDVIERGVFNARRAASEEHAESAARRGEMVKRAEPLKSWGRRKRKKTRVAYRDGTIGEELQ